MTGAKVYHNQSNIYRLTPEQIADLDRRITARIEKTKAQGGAAPDQAKQEDVSEPQRTPAARGLKRA